MQKWLKSNRFSTVICTSVDNAQLMFSCYINILVSTDFFAGEILILNWLNAEVNLTINLQHVQEIDMIKKTKATLWVWTAYLGILSRTPNLTR